MFADILKLIFPRNCVACSNTLRKNEDHLCSQCLVDLPQTRFHENKDNILAKTFWGRLTTEHALAFLFFKKGNAVQHILHEIKYKNNTDLALFIGQYYGSILAQANIRFDGAMAIPLHKSKLKKRGYNQSEEIVKGLCQSLQTENLSKYIVRKKATDTQTKKSRFARWENVEEVFEITTPEQLTGKHILLVDDVITTGATIEACGNKILQVRNCKLSIASIAFASH
jgi:ComF family protein